MIMHVCKFIEKIGNIYYSFVDEIANGVIVTKTFLQNTKINAKEQQIQRKRT